MRLIVLQNSGPANGFLPALTAQLFCLEPHPVRESAKLDEGGGTSVAERMLDLLECLSSFPLTVKELSAASGIPLSTTHRLLRPLVARKYVLRHGRGRYMLGMASMELGARTDLDPIITSTTRPVIAGLAKACKRTTHLGVFRDNLVRYLVKVEAGHLRPPSQEMTELEAYYTGIGKVLLAQLAHDQLEEYLSPGDFVPITPNTISDADGLRLEVDQVRKQGWAMDRGEMYPELRCLAVPINDPTGSLKAAISVTEVCSNRNFEEVEERLLTFLPRMTEAAQAISALLQAP